MDAKTPSAAVFDREGWEARLQAGTRNNPGGSGYIATIVDRGPAGARYDSPREVFNSRSQHLDAGVFPELEQATKYAERRRLAELARRERVHELKVRRGLELGARLRELGLERGHLEHEKKTIGNRLKRNEDKQRALVDEANEPEVELHLTPMSDAWRLFDQPTETDGTLETDSRQLVLEHTGLEPIRPAASEDDDEAPAPPTALHVPEGKDVEQDTAAPDQSRKLPKTFESNGKRIKVGDRVELYTGHSLVCEGWLVEIARWLKGDALGVTIVDDDGGAHHCASHQLRRLKKPRGKKAPPWPPEGKQDDDQADEIMGDTTVTVGHEDAGDFTPKWPKGVKDRDGKGLREGSWVRVLGTGGKPGFEGKCSAAWAHDSEGFRIAVQTFDSEGREGPIREASLPLVERITKPTPRRKPKGEPAVDEPAPQGMDPGGVVWPEDAEPDL